MKTQEFTTEGYPYAKVVCYTCSLGGNELGKVFAEGPEQVFAAGQIELLEKIARVHNRSKHGSYGNIRLETYVRAEEQASEG